ncbi:nuclear pore complex protein NUP107-like isoform X1 [Zingiber officinale]|uniref:nuclear pore complex protein NUP107-like isoform X1 n=1 Tax=Zingiber officinale TaxID=94328 RepID=UPI001C4CEACA|nr:nuclear pore complex protein NUP107-like isoform X1 [Zingiber officinale]
MDMDTSPIYFDPQDLSSREQYRRYRKRQSTSNVSPISGQSVSKFSEARLLYEGNNIQRRPNTALVLEDIKEEVTSIDSHLVSEFKFGSDSIRQGTHSLKLIKNEDDGLGESGDSTFRLFASLLDSALQGLMPFADLILQFEKACRSVSESIRYGSTGRHRVVEDRFMQQKARLLLDEAASWSLLWHLFGKGNEELPSKLLLSPPTSHQRACQFVMMDHTAQLCLRIILWLEGLASESLDLAKRVRGSHVGSYFPNSGVWIHTQRFLKNKKDDPAIVHHVDFDAPTREVAQPILDDKKQDESLLEDIWTLLRAGRLEEACELCRSAGQPWRAASLCPFGGLEHFPSVEAMHKNGNMRQLQATELESGIGHQWRLWRWASYCASEKIAEQDGGRYEMAVYAAQSSNLRRLLPICTDWESACWAMAKSWLHVQVDIELSQPQQGRVEGKPFGDDVNGSTVESWPYHVFDQQPRDLPALLQKLHSSEVVNETVSRACKEQHRQIEINLMLGDIGHLLELLWAWISPAEDDQNILRPNGDPELIRFGAHVVLVLRNLLDDDMKEAFKEKLMVVGDLILHMYSMFLFSKQHEELVGIYASQLARHLCVDLFVQMMELRLNSSIHVKYKIFLLGMEYLPFSSEDGSKACFEEIIEKVLLRSRETKPNKYDGKLSDVVEQLRLQSLQKATVIQWLCFSPPSTIRHFEIINAKLLTRALLHSNILFREFSLISLSRVPKLPIGPHMLLSFLAEPLKQPEETLLSLEEDDVSENLEEFKDWREYYACDATYRNWLKFELENGAIPPSEISSEEKDRAIAAAVETLNTSLSLLLRGTPWLNAANSSIHDPTGNVYIELHATAMLCLPSGECMIPDATSCTTLTSALYSSVSDDDVVNRELRVNVAISSSDNYCVEIVLRCLAVDGDGLGLHEANDGGLLATIMAAGFKGELNRFQPGVRMEIFRLDAWYFKEDLLINPANYIAKGLNRRCCLPEIILRCMQVSVSLAEMGNLKDHRDALVELVASSEYGILHLFSHHQLQEFLLIERECSLHAMEYEEELSVINSQQE